MHANFFAHKQKIYWSPSPIPWILTCRWYLRGGSSGNGSFVALIFHRISFINCVFKLFFYNSLFFNNFFFSQIYTSYRATSIFSGCFQQTTFLTRWNSSISIFELIDQRCTEKFNLQWLLVYLFNLIFYWNNLFAETIK